MCCCISGVDSGINLKVEGEGGESPGRGMRPGNLYVEIDVERDPYFIRKVSGCYHILRHWCWVGVLLFLREEDWDDDMIRKNASHLSLKQ